MDEKPKYGKVLQFFSNHPLIGFIGTVGSIASIVALPFTLLPWLVAPKRQLSFCVYPVRTILGQSEGPITVSYKGTPVRGILGATQVAIWNSGRESIKPEDLLKPVTLLVSNVHVLEITVTKTSREETQFHEGQLAEFLKLKEPVPFNGTKEFHPSNTVFAASIPLEWRILEKGDGGLVQIVYEGTVPIVNVSGTIVGQGAPIEVSSKTQRFTFRQFFVPFFLTCIFMLLLTVWSVFGKKYDFNTFVKIGVVIIVFGIYLLVLLNFQPSLTPFGF